MRLGLNPAALPSVCSITRATSARKGLHREPHGAASRVRRRGDEGDEEHLELVERDGLERDGRGAARSGRRGRGLGLRVARAVDGLRGGNAGIRTHRDGNQRGGRGEDHDGKEGRHPRPNACGRHRRVMRVLPERRATAVRPSCGKPRRGSSTPVERTQCRDEFSTTSSFMMEDSVRSVTKSARHPTS